MIRTFIFCCLAAMISPAASAQRPVSRPDSATVSDLVKYRGKLKDAIRWTDKFGDHLVITTETGIYQNPAFDQEGDGADGELFAYHFILEDTVRQAWKIYDYISDCPVDIVVSFIPGTLQKTDIDRDGVAEIWVMYRTVCHGDVSPENMKIIMYEGQLKHAMRGENKVQYSDTDFTGGEYKFDTAFNNAPRAFRDFAIRLWNRHIMMPAGK